jgi:hypothetical protein
VCLKRKPPGILHSVYECPVCRHAELTAAPYERWPPAPGADLVPPYEDALGLPSYEVCPRCGYEFGNDDNPGTAEPQSFDEYRQEWEAQGRPWFSLRAELAALQAHVAAGEVTPDDAYGAFERLTFKLSGVDPDDDARLRGWANDIERIRVTLLAENQADAVADVLRQARPLFDRLA